MKMIHCVEIFCCCAVLLPRLSSAREQIFKSIPLPPPQLLWWCEIRAVNEHSRSGTVPGEGPYLSLLLAKSAD